MFITKSRPCSIQRIFSALKIEHLIEKKVDFYMFAQNNDCYLQNFYEDALSMFWNKNKKIGIQL